MEIQQRYKEAVTACQDNRDFSGLRDLMADATSHLGFLGDRYITVEGCEGTLHLDQVPVVFLQESTEEIRWWHRSVVDELSSRISDIYIQYDQILRTSNLFSRILGILRETFDFTFFRESSLCNYKLFSRKRWMLRTMWGWVDRDIYRIQPAYKRDANEWPYSVPWRKS